MNCEKIKIYLKDFDDVRKFVSVAQSFMSDVDIIKGKAVIDAKSVLGLLAIDLTGDVYARIISDDVAENRRFDAEMENFR